MYFTNWQKRISFLNLGWPELVLIIIILLFLFGASRLKDIAKALGESVREFKKASSEPSKQKEEEAVVDAARKMGIDTEGKSLKQILEEMNKKVAEK